MSITNARRVKDLILSFQAESDLPEICEDPPIVYTEEHVKRVEGFRQYSKGALDVMASAVQDRACDIFEKALEHADGKGLINDKVLQKLNLYSYADASAEATE